MSTEARKFHPVWDTLLLIFFVGWSAFMMYVVTHASDDDLLILINTME